MTIGIKKSVTKLRYKRKGFNAKNFSGKLRDVFGDPVKYQKRLRDEWS
jgi:hypothetical protein